jgi:histidinol-phosphate aminotransferase
MSVKTLKALFRPELGEISAYRVPSAAPEVKLDANESPWSLPGEAWESILSVVRRTGLHRYPDGRATRLREALAKQLGGAPDEYVLGSGSDEVIALLATAMSKPRPGKECPAVLFPEPTFVMYGITSRAHGWRAVAVPLDDRWDLDVDAMADAFEREQPNVAYYASPNNPTGNCFSPERLERLILRFPDTLHVIDEAYGGFARERFANRCAEHPQCAVLGTLSKVGLAAIRVGWVRLDRALAHEVEKVRQPFNLNTLSQEIATLALTDLAPTFRTHIAAVVTERELLIEKLARHSSLHCFPSDANFLLLRYEGDVTKLCEDLLSRQIAIRRFSKGDARLQDCIRITVGTPEENRRLVTALDEILCP